MRCWRHDGDGMRMNGGSLERAPIDKNCLRYEIDSDANIVTNDNHRSLTGKYEDVGGVIVAAMVETSFVHH